MRRNPVGEVHAERRANPTHNQCTQHSAGHMRQFKLKLKSCPFIQARQVPRNSRHLSNRNAISIEIGRRSNVMGYGTEGSRSKGRNKWEKCYIG